MMFCIASGYKVFNLPLMSTCLYKYLNMNSIFLSFHVYKTLINDCIIPYFIYKLNALQYYLLRIMSRGQLIFGGNLSHDAIVIYTNPYPANTESD